MKSLYPEGLPLAGDWFEETAMNEVLEKYAD